jgi:hypothetical protein
VTQSSGYDVAPRISGQFCPMLAVDIAEFTRPDRGDETQLYLRMCLYDMLREACDESGVPWDQGQHEDRGDGVVVIFPPGQAAPPLIDAFPDRLQCLIRHHNRNCYEPARMQLRVVVHVGPVYGDEHGFAGHEVTYLFRMLDAQPLRRALAGSCAEFAFMISDYVYAKLVVDRQSLADRRSFRRVCTQVKRTSVHGWIYRPDGPLP